MRFIENYPIDQITPADYNPRKIKENAFEKLQESLLKFGVCKAVIANLDGTIVAGHQRTKAMKAVGINHCPIFILEKNVSLQDEIKFNLMHNSVETETAKMRIDNAADLPFGFTLIENTHLEAVHKGKGSIIKEISRLISKYGDYGNIIVDEDGNVIHNADYAYCCKLLGNDCVVYKMHNEHVREYGEVRWIGQLLGVDGSRRAESLNNNYFINGRHTPLLIMIKGGTLTEDSYTKLQEYMNGIKGEQGQHAFIILEAENAEQRTDFDTSDKPEIEIKDIASILQKDELFQEYLENNRKRVQSAFLLPDLYVGYTTDFNRATAQTAKEVTEEQVFQPERISLAWVINNKLLNGYQFKHVEAYFLAPNITNPDDLYKILTVSNNAGGLTPNKAKDVVYRMLGETSEDYEEEWGDIPLKIYAERNSSTTDMNGIAAQLTQQIQKAQSNNTPDEVVSVMKSVQKLLKEIKEQEGKQ